MKAFLLVSVLAVALCEVASLRHQKRQNSGDQDAVARCCYPRKYGGTSTQSYWFTSTSSDENGEPKTEVTVSMLDFRFNG